VDNKKQYLERLRAAVEHMHKCVAVQSETIPVQEVFQGKTVWQGNVERFLLLNHPKATVAYAWSDKEGERDGGERFVAVLELPPVNSAKRAVQIQMVKDFKESHVSKN
jgi:hypothetical protein